MHTFKQSLLNCITGLALALSGLPSLAEVVLLPGGEKTEWKYFDDGGSPGEAWTGAAFDDSKWKQGKAPLGYGQDNLTTRLSFGPDAEAKHITAYFRTSFKADGKDKLDKLGLLLRRDDGAVVYVNGKEAARSNMPEGSVSATTLAATQLSRGPQEQYHLTIVPASSLAKDGADTIAVEIHQGDPGSSDLGFDLKITGYAAGEAPEGPKRDFYREGMTAVSRGNYGEAAKLLGQVDPKHPQYTRTMAMLGWQIYGEALGRAKDGLPFVKKAYDAAPEDRDIVRAYIKTHVVSGVLFDNKDIARERKKTVAQEHAFLVTNPKITDTSQKIPRAKLEADLDYLEHLLTKCFAYLELRPVDYRAALDAIRLSLEDETPVNTFAIRVTKLISLFCDGHAHVQHSVPPGYASWLAGSYKGRTYLCNTSGKSFLDPEHPYVVEIDGKPIDEWMKAAGYLVVKESPQWHLRGALEMLSHVTYLRAELGLPDDDSINLKLESDDRKKKKDVKVSRQMRPVRRAEFPHGETRRIGDFGYLRLSRMTSSQSVLDDLDDWMAKFRDTKGLIMDLRGNTGGTKSILHTLFPYFMKPGAPMRIVEMSTYRLPMALPKPNPGGFGMSTMSGQSVGSSFWKTDAERKQVADFIKGFKTEWKLPEGKFTEWHAMGLDAKVNPKAYYYDRPLIVLQDSSTFSAGDIFAGAFEEHPNTTQIGMPTGGGNGKMDDYTLPNSKLGIVLCWSAKFRANGKLYDGTGIAPDVQMEATPQDLFGETDTVLDAAVKKLHESSKTPAPDKPAKHPR